MYVYTRTHQTQEYYCQEYYRQYDLSLLMLLVSITRFEVVFVRFLHCKVTPLFPFSILYTLEGSTAHSPHLRYGELYSIP